MGRWRVTLGFIAGLAYAAFAHVASDRRLALGLGVAFLGLLLRGRAAGFLEKGKRLAQDGPYAFWRHPLYAGSTFMAFGFCLAGTGTDKIEHSFLIWLTFFLLFFVVYPPRIREEEASLEKYFGDAWRQFHGRTFRYLPRFPPFRRPDADRFSWARYRKNREHNAALGWLAGAGLLWAKAYFQI